MYFSTLLVDQSSHAINSSFIMIKSNVILFCWFSLIHITFANRLGCVCESTEDVCELTVCEVTRLRSDRIPRYFTVFVFCNWSLLCLFFIDWFMEYCPVAWQRENTQVSVKQPTSGQREKRPPTQVSNAHVQMLWKSCSLSPCKEKAVSSDLQVAKSWMF